MKKLLVTIADRNYLNISRKLFASILANKTWIDDFMLITTNDVEDKDLKWRKYVNEKLKKEYKKVFSMIDHYVFMKVPNFKMVFKWRLLQEKKLKKKSSYKKKTMSNNEIKRFIMFYQRITLQMVKDLSKSASVVMLLNKNHKITKVIFRS